MADTIRDQIIGNDDVMSEFKSYEELHSENITDFKTGLLNERGFSRELQRQVEHATRTGERLTIVFIDADNFKKINGKYEYYGGDIVLRTIAAAMSDELRKDDVKARWGGDEFVALMSRENKRKPSPEVENLGSRMNENIKSNLPQEIDPIDVSVTLASIEWNGEAADVLLRKVQKHILEHKSKNV